jgi:ThiF family
MTWTVSMTAADYAALTAHIHRGDGDEHAAFCYAGAAFRQSGARLLVRRVIPVPDEEFPLSTGDGYRSITPRAVARAAIECDAEGLCLMWVHNHPESNASVELSRQDRRTAARVHPVLADLTDRRPVAAIVLGTSGAAGEVWTPDGVEPIDGVRVIGSPIIELRPGPLPDVACDERFARQVLLFGEMGQRRLRELTVAIVGLGGGGSLIAQTLACLGVGAIILIDHDVIKRLNLSRIVGATPTDIGRLKVDVAARLVHSIDPVITIEPISGDVTYTEDVRALTAADVVFLATDTAFARHAVNLVCHQYLIPFFQVGAKVSTSPDNGQVTQIHVADRPFLFTSGCMHCAGIIPLDALQREQQDEETNRVQDYLGAAGRDIEDPSVITLNSIATSLATTDFLFTVTGLAQDPYPQAIVAYPIERAMRSRSAPALPGCLYCDPVPALSARSRGDLWALQLRPGHSPSFSRRPVPVAHSGLVRRIRRHLHRPIS